MSFNQFGQAFRITTWGESHGEAIGVVIDGMPPGIHLTTSDIQPFLDQRRPGQSKFTTQRQEADLVRIVSGVFEDKTMGTPISLIIENTNQKSKDYGDIAQSFRPGHADYTYFAKYGIRDYRGGGRSSARETAMRVAAGAVARKLLADPTHGLPTEATNSFSIKGAMVAMGDDWISSAHCDFDLAKSNPFFCPDPEALLRWQNKLQTIRKQGSSIGAVIEVVAENIPAGLGAPLYAKLDQDLASAMMSINAVKGVEIGDGFAAAGLTGEENADEIRMGDDNQPVFSSNHAGGILGGISSGQPIVVRFSVKPTSSILIPRQTINEKGEEVDLITKGRHDPCVGIRAVPVGEAMMAITLADHWLRHRAQTGGSFHKPAL